MRNLAEINLNLLRENAKNIRKNLPKSTLFCAVVKADGYGHGGVACAEALYSICDVFAVALVEEGIELRLGGIDKEILVLLPSIKKDLERAISFGLTLTVDEIKGLMEVEKVAKSLRKTVRVHVAYNTGMNRLGVDGIKNLKKLLDKAKDCEFVKISGFYSHFGCPENDKLLNQALDKFLLANKVVKGYNNNVISHISASGGFLKGVYLDMVRIGILLYGYKPFKSSAISVKPIMKVYSHVVKSRALKKGERCMYGKIKSDKSRHISIVRVGYADGFFRKKVKGQFNNRCMDLTAVRYKKAHRVCVLNNADILAKKYNTISYEILSRATTRAEKKYIR